MAPQGVSQSPASLEPEDMTRIRLGITTPVLSMVPDAHASWETDGSIDDVAAIARAADALGYDHLTCSEHVIVPTDVAATRGSRYWDPLATFGYLAAVTSRIRSGHQRVGARLSPPPRDRQAVRHTRPGLGRPGHPRPRGRLAGGGVRAPRSSPSTTGDCGPTTPWPPCGSRSPSGSPSTTVAYYRYSEVVLDPCARQSPVPLWIGGRTARSLRRAVELADGWVPFGIRAADVAAMLADARTTPAWSSRTRPLDVVLRNGRPLDPIDDPDGARADRAETARRPGPPACSCGSPTARWPTTSSSSRRWPESWASRRPEEAHEPGQGRVLLPVPPFPERR